MKEIPVKLWYFIAAISLLRIIIASSLDLGNDEVYYWTYALDLQWNYFDHPPFVAWLIRATTANLYIHKELAVRFGAISSSAIATIITFKIGKLLMNDRVGWYAVLLYSSSLYCSIISGTFILPDSPQMAFWLWSIFLLLKMIRSIDQGLPVLNLWCWFGLATGLCMMCKIHGVFLWLAVLLLALFSNRKLFRQKGMYLSALISLIILSPVIIWNIQHHFITYTYHSDRISFFHAGVNPLAFTREISGEIFYNNPILFFLAWVSVFALFKIKDQKLKIEKKVLLYCALPLIFTLIFFSIFRDTLPHWSGPAYSCLIFISALQLESYAKIKAKRIVKAAMLFFLLLVAIGIPVINFYSGSLSPKQDTLHWGKGDPTLDLYGWEETAIAVDSVYKSDLKLNKIKAAHSLMVTKWFPAAHLDFYICNKTGLNTYGIGEIFDLHQYYWSNQSKKPLTVGDNAYYIVPSNLYDESDVEFVKSQFEKCSTPLILPIFRNGAVCKSVIIFRLNGYK